MPIFSECYLKAVENTNRSNSCPAIKKKFGVNSDLNTSSRMQSHSDDHLKIIGKKSPTMWTLTLQRSLILSKQVVIVEMKQSF